MWGLEQEKWGLEIEQENAFLEAKAQLTSKCLLVHFDLQLRVFLSCDASPYSIVAVLLHESPNSFASKSLSVAEKVYS